jgi:hypothetical protein
MPELWKRSTYFGGPMLTFMETIDLIMVVGLLTFPSILFFTLLHSKVLRFNDFFKFVLYSNNLAVNYASDLVEEYKITIFAPNIIGVFANTVEKVYTIFKVSGTVISMLLTYHLTLLVISAVGLGILKISKSRVFLAFLGEIVTNWALISGNLLFIYLLSNLYISLKHAMLLIMVFIVILYLLIMSYFVVAQSVKTYVEGARLWKKSVSSD